MRNLLQYGYSILVFAGVLTTAYLALNKEGNARLPLRALQTPSYRSDATIVDPAVTQLFQMEDALSRMEKGERFEQRRPSRIEIILPSNEAVSQ
jgi:hypothetical protein